MILWLYWKQGLEQPGPSQSGLICPFDPASISTLQIGHFLLVVSHWSTHSMWNRCIHGKRLQNMKMEGKLTSKINWSQITSNWQYFIYRFFTYTFKEKAVAPTFLNNSASHERSFDIHWLTTLGLWSNSAWWRNSVGHWCRVLLHFAQQSYIPCC